MPEKPRTGLLNGLRVLVVLVGLGAAVHAPAQAPPGEAFLVTYGPGEVYWQRFGHNAIWLREPGRDLDHTFNFGFFDFEQENFLLNFVQGRMLYFSAAIPAERELAFYRGEGRAIRLQRLQLEPEEYRRLREHLLTSVLPDHREYLYDYYLDNCSTRLRDALDQALEGRLRRQFGALPGEQSFRDHTRRSTQGDSAYYLGLELGLGSRVDQPVSAWDEMFLPAVLAESLAQLRRPDGSPQLSEDRLLEPGSASLPPDSPAAVWWRYGLLSVTLVLIAWLASRLARGVLTESFVLAWLFISASLGLGLMVFWFATDHVAAANNWNLFLCNPLWSLALLRPARRAVAAMLFLGLGVSAVTGLILSWQYLVDVWVFCAPLNLFAAFWLWRYPAPMLSGRRSPIAA